MFSRVAIVNRGAAATRITKRQEELAAASGSDRAALNSLRTEEQPAVRAEKLGEVAAEFDQIHSIERAVEVGSVDAIISAADLRPRIIEALGHGTN